MKFIDKLVQWASTAGSGRKADPGSSLRGRGWLDGEQPPAPYENQLRYESDGKVNEIIDALNINSDNDYSDTVYDRCSGIPNTNALLRPQSAENTVEFDGLLSVCRGYDLKNNRECIFGISGTDTLLCIYNDSDYTVQSDSFTLGSISGDLIDLCCDGYYIYIATQNSSTHIGSIHKYALSSSTIVNTTRVSVQSTPYAVYWIKPTGTSSSTLWGKQICVADSINIAYLDFYNLRFGIMPKSLATTGTIGRGQISNAYFTSEGYSVDHLRPAICSDGTHIWTILTASKAAADYDFLVAALIADVSDTTAGLSRDPDTLIAGPDYSSHDVVFDGALVYATTQHFNGSTVHDFRISQYDYTNGLFAKNRIIIENGSTGSNYSDARVIAGFTGRQLAIAGPYVPKDDITSDTIYDCWNFNQIGLALIDHIPAPCDEDGDYDSLTFDESIFTPLCSYEPSVSTDVQNIGPCIYSDDCIWLLIRKFISGAGYSYDTSYLIRVPSISRR